MTAERWTGPRLRLLVALLCAAAGTSLIVGGSPRAARAADLPASPLTKTGTGPFSSLNITVSQTKALINQVVEVSWTGGQPTKPANGNYYLNYLQIMQCWGDAPSGPTREQCEFGGRLGDPRGGAQSSTRQVSYGSTLVDPQETEYVKQPGQVGNVYVPFDGVDGTVTTGSRSSFFDASTTNELPYARTRADGSGDELFEIQTGQEAPGLGCGRSVPAPDGGTEGRSCWLVVVPRGNTEVDGSVRLGSAAFQLDSSPLSTTNWAHRIVFPLEFQEISRACDLARERRVIGQEVASEAVTRWQPALCLNGGTTFNYSQVSDRFARRQLVTSNPSLAFVSSAVAPSDVPARRPLVYAPVALSGLAISYIVERQPSAFAPDAELAKEGSRITNLRLTPRLVAKLLTQSYGNAVPIGDPAVAGNPDTVVGDPEFLALNPDFTDLVYPNLSDILVPIGQSDAAQTLWNWIVSDPDARDFLAGKPDPFGMHVNPAFQGMSATDELPKNDAYCRPFNDDRIPQCTLERRPYAASLHDAARSASRGDTQARETWDPLATPPAWKKSEAQYNGTRAVLALTDLATAARYGLQTASLRNAGGQFVGPTTEGLLAGLDAMQPGPVADVLEPVSSTTAPGAYPLTTLTYAATAPAALTPAAGAEYASLIEYAALDGQDPGVAPGTLPEGYVPLPRSFRSQALIAAATIRRQAGVLVTPSPTTTTQPVGSTSTSTPTPTTSTSSSPAPSASETPSASPTESASSPGSGSSSGGLGSSLGGAPGPSGGAPAPTAAPTPSGSPSETSASVAPVAQTALTPAEPLGGIRYALAVLLLLGSLAALTGPALLRAGGRQA